MLCFNSSNKHLDFHEERMKKIKGVWYHSANSTQSVKGPAL